MKSFPEGQIQVFSCWRKMCNFSLPWYMPHFLLYLALPQSKLSTKHVSNSMIILNISSQVFQWAKLWLITNWPINLSTGCPIKFTIHTKMAKQFGLGFQWVKYFTLSYSSWWIDFCLWTSLYDETQRLHFPCGKHLQLTYLSNCMFRNFPPSSTSTHPFLISS